MRKFLCINLSLHTYHRLKPISPHISPFETYRLPVLSLPYKLCTTFFNNFTFYKILCFCINPLHLPGMVVLIGFLCSSITQATAEDIRIGSPCIQGSHVGYLLYSVNFESSPLPCRSVFLPSSLPYPLHAFWTDVTDPTNLTSLLPLPSLPPGMNGKAVTLKYGNNSLSRKIAMWV